MSGGGNGSFGWLVPGQSPRQIVAMGQAAGESCSLTLTGSDSTGSGVVSTAKGNLALALVVGTPAFSVSAGSLVIARPGTYILDLDISCALLCTAMPTYDWAAFTASLGGAAGASRESHFHWTLGATGAPPTVSGEMGDGAAHVAARFTIADGGVPASVTFQVQASGGPAVFSIGDASQGQLGQTDSACRVVRLGP